MRALSRSIERLATAVLLVGGVGMLMSMLLGVADIVGTQVLSVPVPGPRELTESTMVLIVFGALAYAQVRRAHIRVELVYIRMGPRVQAAMDVFTDLCAILFFSLMMWQGYHEAVYSMDIGEATVGLIRFPLWPARIMLVVGCGLLVLRLVFDLFTDIGRIKTGAPLPDAAAAPNEKLGD